ncbi:MAG: tetratricopeptide repeat protein [Myxococcota bacterium]
MRICVLVGALLAASPAVAQDAALGNTNDEAARRIYALGTEAFEAERFSEAANYYQRAYDLSPRAELLFNLGAAQQRAGAIPEAVAAFERFLEETPDAHPQRPEAEARLSALRLRLAEAQTVEEESVPVATSREATSTAEGPGAAPWVLVIGGSAAAIGGVGVGSLRQIQRRRLGQWHVLGRRRVAGRPRRTLFDRRDLAPFGRRSGHRE